MQVVGNRAPTPFKKDDELSPTTKAAEEKKYTIVHVMAAVLALLKKL
jgi:hypothetical protein